MAVKHIYTSNFYKFSCNLFQNSVHDSGEMWKVTYETFIVLPLWFLLANTITDAERILVITPTPFYSHQIVFRALCSALNKRGHELTVVTLQPMKDSTLKNYTEIDLDLNSYNQLKKQYTDSVSQLPMIDLLKLGWKLSHQVSTKIFNDPQVKKLYRYNSNERFDAVILEPTSYLSLGAMAYRFNAPLIGKTISADNAYKLFCN